MKQHDRTKLPRWAQDELAQKDRRISELEHELRAAHVPMDDVEEHGPHFMYREWFPELRPIGLPHWIRSNPRVSFLDPTRWDSRALRCPRFDVQYDPKADAIRVMVDNAAVVPYSSNVVDIYSRDIR